MQRQTEPASDRAAEPPRASVIAANVVGSLITAAICVAIFFGVGVALVWTTGRMETWLDLPAMSMLVAVLGLGLVASVFIGAGRIVGASRARQSTLDMLSDLMRRADEDEDEDEDEADEQLKFVRSWRGFGSRG